jgi:PAS domain S-box-containing protein
VGAGYATAAGVAVLSICLSNQTGWLSAAAAHMSFVAQGAQMTPITEIITALCAIALAAAGCNAILSSASPFFRIVVWSCSAVALLLAVDRLTAHLTGWDLGLQRLGLEDDPHSHAAILPVTTLLLTCVGAALLLTYEPRWARTSRTLTILALLGAWIGFTRFLFGETPLDFFNRMSVQTSISVLLLSTGVLALRSKQGLTALLVSRGPAGVSSRQLLPAALIAPFVIGAAVFYAERVGTLSVGQSYALVAISSVLVFASLVWTSSLRLERMDGERKQALEALRDSEVRFRSLAESLPQLIWTCNAAGHCDYLSRQWEDYTGIGADQPSDRIWHDCVHPDDSAQLAARWNAATASGNNFLCEHRLRRRDGIYRWFSARASPQRDENGHVTRWFGATTDIEDQRHAQDAQLRSQKMEALGTLAGGIAHDFNNILLSISGNTGLALEDLSAGHPARASLLEIERASRRAADLVRRILAFSRKEEPRSETLYLQPVIEEALKLLRPTLPAQIQLRAHFNTGVPATICDATQVQQILMNLSTNAAHAIGERPGNIEIKLTTATITPEHSTDILRAGLYACLEVSDNGCGMTRQTRDRIFDPFFTTKPNGTGLGLSVVHGIMKAHGGAVTAYSEPDHGTSFKLYFPATGGAPVNTVPAEPSKPAHASGQRVLYVDDDESLVMLTTRKLTRLGYTLTGKTDPRAALELFRQDPFAFDAVVSDLSMPGMPGFELAREMLALRADLPIIMTSGFVRPEDQQTAQQIGVLALILKPGTHDELGKALERALGSRD